MTTETPPRPRRRTSPDPSLPRLSALGWVRWAWRQLTSMRTALFLLLTLSTLFPTRIFTTEPDTYVSSSEYHRGSASNVSRFVTSYTVRAPPSERQHI